MLMTTAPKGMFSVFSNSCSTSLSLNPQGSKTSCYQKARDASYHNSTKHQGGSPKTSTQPSKARRDIRTGKGTGMVRRASPITLSEPASYPRGLEPTP